MVNHHCDPFCYPLLFPHGDMGWHPDLWHAEGRRRAQRIRTTQLQFYSYHLALREGFSLLHSSGKLFQQYVVEACVKTEGNRLQFIRDNQAQLRCDSYHMLMDYVANLAAEDITHPRRMLILPSTFSGSPRNMQQNYQDAMGIVRKFAKPDLFITVTCNPRWNEIQENVPVWQKVESRPDLIAR